MTEKRKSPCTAGTVTEARQNLQEQYSGDFPESQAEEIFQRDTRRIYIGALIMMICYTLARLGGWIA